MTLPTDDRPPDPAALVAWYSAMGVDVATEDKPVDRLSAPPPKPAVPRQAIPRATVEANPLRAQPRAAPVVVAPSDDAAKTAKASAKAARTLDELRDTLARFEGCNLRLTATQLVFADGKPGSRVMFVGEAPGRDEDIRGFPFVGPSGQLLDRMLAAIGLSRESVYIANVVPWRPPGNRTPTPQETAICRPFIERQIELADPDFLVLLGGASAKELLGTADGILKLRGRWRDFDTGTRTIKAMATLHPAYLLRRAMEKRLAWRDFMALKKALDASPG